MQYCFGRGIRISGNPAAIWKSQRNLRFPLFSQGFSARAFAADSVPRSALGAPLGLLGFAVKRVLAKSIGFIKVFRSFLGNYGRVPTASNVVLGPPSDDIAHHKGAFVFLCFSKGFRTRLCGGLGSAKRTRGPAGPARICCKAGIGQKHWFLKVFSRFLG